MELAFMKTHPSSLKSNKSYLTAIKRKGLSAPMQYLIGEDLIIGSVLDYGCGRGVDANLINAERYDPYWFSAPLVDKYDTITCIYVLNVIQNPCERIDVLHKLYKLLNPNGIAYIAVRRDSFTEGRTSKGTWQGKINLDLPVLVEAKNRFCIYKIIKKDYSINQITKGADYET